MNIKLYTNTKMNSKVYLPLEVIKDGRLTAATKRVAFWLFQYVGWNNKTQYMPKDTFISQELHISSKTVQRARNSLIKTGYLSIDDNKEFHFYIAGLEYTNKADLSNKEINNMFGNFIAVPRYINYIEDLTDAQVIILMMYFDYFFQYDGNEWKPKRKIVEKDLANLYHLDYDTLTGQIADIKKAGWIDYKVMLTKKEDGSVKRTIIEAKVKPARVKIVPYDKEKDDKELEVVAKKQEEYANQMNKEMEREVDFQKDIDWANNEAGRLAKDKHPFIRQKVYNLLMKESGKIGRVLTEEVMKKINDIIGE